MPSVFTTSLESTLSKIRENVPRAERVVTLTKKSCALIRPASRTRLCESHFLEKGFRKTSTDFVFAFCPPVGGVWGGLRVGFSDFYFGDLKYPNSLFLLNLVELFLIDQVQFCQVQK